HGVGHDQLRRRPRRLGGGVTDPVVRREHGTHQRGSRHRGREPVMDVALGASVPEAANQPKPQFDAPEQVLDDRLTHAATITTSAGPIEVELFSQESPVTANNFAFLASRGFYDGTVIHRIVPGFVVQMGDPTGTGTGGPGYRFRDELS